MYLLTEQVKRKLNITWDDDDTNSRVEEIVESAKAYLTHRLGIADSNFDFTKLGNENTLLKNYCLYEWNHCLEEFEKNYQSLIETCRRQHEVENYRKENHEVQ